MASRSRYPFARAGELRDLLEQTFEEFVAMWERCTQEPEYIPPIGDSAKQAGQRLFSFLLELAEQHPPQSTIVIVTYGGLITDFLLSIYSHYAKAAVVKERGTHSE